jgi:2,4-dienoyl-CoA reductase-like NADH-dependent reductase (Old Yellow Enzyme family)/thioredoxin reductase
LSFYGVQQYNQVSCVAQAVSGQPGSREAPKLPLCFSGNLKAKKARRLKMVNAFETFPNLLYPLKVGNVVFRNRIFNAPMGHTEIAYDGQPTIDGVMFFERKAIGGAATVAEGEVAVDPAEFRVGRWPRQITRMNNYNYPRFASVVSRHGAVPVIELYFSGGGPHPASKMLGTPLEGPVEITTPDGKKYPPMTEKRIFEIIDGYGKAALAAKNAGVGRVCIHAAHGRALQQWMSPSMNTRTDKWGGNPENRCRFAVLALDEIKRVCGGDYPVEIRISGSEIVKEGYGVDEGCRIAEQLDGHADIINVSVGWLDGYTCAESFARTSLSLFYPQGRNVEYAAEIKKRVKKSLVGAVGGLNDPYYMEDILATGKADIVYLGREVICDPDLPNKVRTGRPEEIRKCMRCLQCFTEGVSHGDFLCAINPEVNRDRENYYSLPTPKKQRVLIIGGGISGMQAALTANQNGHDVILCEKSGELGGQILCEREVPFKENLHKYIEQQKVLIGGTNIDLRLNTEVTPEYAKNERPDVILAAVGSEPIKPNIPGINGDNVYQAIEVFRKPALAKGKTVIIGAGLAGAELAIYLHDLSVCEVEIIEKLGDINNGGNVCHKRAIDDMMEQKNIPIHFNTKAVEITDKGVKCIGPEGEVFFNADTVIHAVGMRPYQDEALTFDKCAPVFHMIGDCRTAANILYATSSAYTAAKFIGRYNYV